MGKLDLSLTAEELEGYLATQRTVRVATVGEDGTPHAIPLWFVWVDGTLFLNSTLGNTAVENAFRRGVAAAVIDDGETYAELRGALLTGPIEPADDDPRLPDVELAWSEKYLGGNPVPFKTWRNRVWLRLPPNRVASWDFRKIPEARAKARKEA
ncbi:MAG: pyridoxamine 5'-phosphate oxidase family protein [Actinomycetota bacterium]